MPFDLSALRVLVDSVLASRDGRRLDTPAEREALAAALVDVLAEFFGLARDDA